MGRQADGDAKTRLPRNARNVLTVREVMRAVDGDHSDGGGLLLRLRPASESWVFRYTAPGSGRRREMGLGHAVRTDAKSSGASLTTAREKANAARILLASGEDPIATRKTVTAAKRAQATEANVVKKVETLTLARAARQYHERVIEPSRSEKHAAQWIASLENHVGDALWDAPIASIEPAALLDRLLELTAAIPETAGRIRQRLDAIFDDAILRKVVTTNPAKPLVRAMRDAEGKRRVEGFRSLPFAKAPEFYRLVSAQDGAAARAVRLLMLTAARTDEILSAQWPEFNIEGAQWIVPAERMKAGEEHVVDLSEPAIEIINAQKLRPTTNDRFVFPSPMIDGQALSNMAMLILLDRISMRTETTIHGLRATFSTWAYESGKYRGDVIEACLAHRERDRVKAAYSRGKFMEERRELLRNWATFLTGDSRSMTT